MHALFAAASAYDTGGVRGQLDLAVEAFGIGGCLDEVVFPAMRQIGRSWRTGHLDVEAERLATEAVRFWLEGLALDAPEPREVAPLLLACGPGDRHSIGLEALGVLLRSRRQPCRMLGARVSVHTMTVAVEANRPSAVVVVSHLRSNRLSATQSLRAAAALGPAVFYAGNAFGSVRMRRNVPGTHLDSGLRGACALILGEQHEA